MSRRRPTLAALPRSPHTILAAAVLLAIVVVPGRASAYTWMIGRGYTGCATCHADPSGGGLLNDFGRDEAAASLRSRYGDREPFPASQLLGLVKAPDWLLAGASFRYLALYMKTGGAPYMTSSIVMQADLRAGISAGPWRAAGSLGVNQNERSPAAVAGDVVAREYWAGYALGNDKILVRAGRMNLPFGVRSIEHTLFVRTATRTDLNDTQQHGVALAFRGGGFRGEVMGIAGNYQLSPDAFRQRGYSGYVEWSPTSRYAFGVSSLVTHAAQDVYLRASNTRQAHGLLVRASPVERLVLLAEVDYVRQAPASLSAWNGLATMVQVDVEPWQGLHLIGTGESYDSGQPGTPTSWGAWGGIGWFFFSYADVRLDYMHRSAAYGGVRVPVDAYMAQFHLFL
jgi:hypothetical protein